MRLLICYICCYLSSSFFLWAQEGPDISFSGIKEELFNSWISCIKQDDKGFIWIGTQDGLHRYDGYQFEVLRNSPEKTQSLGANWIKDIAMDAHGNYWVATFGSGVTKFSPKTMTFINFSKDSLYQLPGKLASNIISFDNNIISATDEGYIIFDTQNYTPLNLGIGRYESPMVSDGNQIWLADSKSKLYSYDIHTRELKHRATFDVSITSLHFVPEIGLIIGSDHKLVLFQGDAVKKELFTEEPITKFTTDGKGNYVMGSQNALYKLQPETFQLDQLSINLDISQLHIETIFLDRQSNLWVGTNKGLYKEKRFNNAFRSKNLQLHARRITKKNDHLYIGGFRGLFKVQKDSIVPLAKDISILSMLHVGDTLYCSGDTAEVYQYIHDRLNKIIPLSKDPDKRLRVMGLALDRKKRLWVGSWEGLHVFDKEHRFLKFIPLETDSDSKEAKIINIQIDSKDRLWIISSAYGLFKIDQVSTNDLSTLSSNITNYRNIEGDKNSLTCDIITSLGEDHQGQMWFGTDIGVVRYKEDTQNFERLYHQGKLFDRKVMSLRNGSDENLWITTINDGIYRYNVQDRAMQHFTKNDGLISNAFLYSSGFVDKDNDLMYFGTDEGIQEVDLSYNFSQKEGYSPIITAFAVNGDEGETTIASPQAPFLDKISLASDQNDFSVDFSAMDYINPEKIRYSYTLDDADWRIADLQTAYFTNVPHGNHVLKVKTINDGNTDEEHISHLDIYIKPPWYLSRMAKVIYFLLFIGGLLGVYNYLKWRWKIKFELRLKDRETVRLQQLNDFKSKLYTDIAHEFKTPLTLISGPIDHKLQDNDLSNEDRSNFSMVKRNTERLTSLVDQVLQLARLEHGKLQIQLTKGNLSLFLHHLSHSFEYQAQLKHMDYAVKIHTLGVAWYDEDIIEKIVINLLSNAFKYSPEHGKCSFSAIKIQDRVQINIKNTILHGQHLELETLFTRFYQYDSYAEGMGVGLSLVKELVNHYGGTIQVQMAEKEIIHFQVDLPIDQEAFEGFNTKSTSIALTSSVVSSTSDSAPADQIEVPSEDKPLLLLVEDHAEVRAFIRQALQHSYKVLEAENGKMGLEIAIAQVPDLIVSDIRMPLYDGIQLCNALKQNPCTDHIPFILLTANSTEESELKGLRSGADAFVTKPFKIQLLEQRICNLIAVRKSLRDRYSQELILKPKDIAITPADEAFLNTIQNILDAHLTDPEFNAALFSKKAAMSRMQLHRKLLTYTGLSTSAFIRSQRLKQALQLLKTSDANINEVAYAVGFNTPSYFMKCFKETFKKTPSEYLQSIDR